MCHLGTPKQQFFSFKNTKMNFLQCHYQIATVPLSYANSATIVL